MATIVMTSSRGFDILIFCYTDFIPWKNRYKLSLSIEIGSICEDLVEFLEVYETSFVSVRLLDHFLKIRFLPFQMA